MPRVQFASLAIAALLAGCAAGQDAPNVAAVPVLGAAVPVSRALPAAVPTPVIRTDKVLTRIAFGSCNHQLRSQDIWPVIGATSPDAMLMIGDNVYGDYGWEGDADLSSFRDAYAIQAADPRFSALRQSTPMLASWDDHDFGPNDSGGAFAFRELSEDLFESFWGSSAEVQSRPGIYDSLIAGPEGQRTQIVMLDTRFFRSSLTRLPYTEDWRPLGNYDRDPSPDVTMLGNAQWAWLETELAKPADLRLLVSSIQVLTDAHRYESWANMPRERERLMEMLASRNGGGLVLLSGDRHSGAIYSDSPAALGEEIHELTSSSLNLAFVRDDASEREPDPIRETDMIVVENFGLVDVDWSDRAVKLALHSDDGAEIVAKTVSF
ncbi:MAG: alkaline phosphatase D family protein [Pacificimonas sp.]